MFKVTLQYDSYLKKHEYNMRGIWGIGICRKRYWLDGSLTCILFSISPFCGTTSIWCGHCTILISSEAELCQFRTQCSYFLWLQLYSKGKLMCCSIRSQQSYDSNSYEAVWGYIGPIFSRWKWPRYVRNSYLCLWACFFLIILMSNIL